MYAANLGYVSIAPDVALCELGHATGTPHALI
jgi:hypothetical protein